MPLAIVVDAFDECDNERDAAAILGLLAFNVEARESQWLRLLLTSCPQTQFHSGIQTLPPECLSRLHLHDIVPPIVDINTRITQQILSETYPLTGFYRTVSPWPTLDKREFLAKNICLIFQFDLLFPKFLVYAFTDLPKNGSKR
jgi:hypothetical protein